MKSDVLFSFKCEQRLFVTLKGHTDITEQIKGLINTSHTRGLEKYIFILVIGPIIRKTF